jgi:alpha(1,3/1,4) fucosyltransferase
MKISVGVSDFFKQNKIFDSKIAGTDFYKILRHKLEKKNIQIATSDIINENDADMIIYENHFGPYKKNSFFIATESIAVIPKFHSKKFLKKFKKSFTWNDSLVDNQKCIKFFLSYNFDSSIDLVDFNKKKLITNISRNKYSSFKDELYSKRVELIKFFDRNHRGNFDLYGEGWDFQFKYPNQYNLIKSLSHCKGFGFFQNFLIKLIVLLKLNDLFFENYNSYKGTIKDKFDILKNYKFNICFENVTNIDSYISEKIFDSFKSGCVPIYYGSNNIDLLIPKKAFIDFRDFKNLEDLNKFLVNMRSHEYERYIKEAQNFIKSEKSKIFRSESNADILIANIL